MIGDRMLVYFVFWKGQFICFVESRLKRGKTNLEEKVEDYFNHLLNNMARNKDILVQVIRSGWTWAIFRIHFISPGLTDGYNQENN